MIIGFRNTIELNKITKMKFQRGFITKKIKIYPFSFFYIHFVYFHFLYSFCLFLIYCIIK